MLDFLRSLQVGKIPRIPQPFPEPISEANMMIKRFRLYMGIKNVLQGPLPEIVLANSSHEATVLFVSPHFPHFNYCTRFLAEFCKFGELFHIIFAHFFEIFNIVVLLFVHVANDVTAKILQHVFSAFGFSWFCLWLFGLPLY